MPHSAIGPIAVHLPETIEDIHQLASMYPRWDFEAIFAKTGVRARHVAGPDECASDLGVAAAEKLFARHRHRPPFDRLPALLHADARLSSCRPRPALCRSGWGCPLRSAALDFNLGCSGFVYGLIAGRRA